MNDFTELVDLAAERLGGAALAANDEFFAPKESLLKAAAPVFLEGRYTERGKWMEDLRIWINNKNATSPEFDYADFAGPALRWGTAADGTMHTLASNYDVWLMFWNQAIFAEKGVPFPKTMDEMLAASRTLTDKSKGIYGMVGRGLKNANLPLYTSFLMGMDQDTVTPDGKTLTWKYTYNCPLQGPTVMREIETRPDANTKTIEMHGKDPKSGKEYKMMVLELTRKAGNAPAAKPARAEAGSSLRCRAGGARRSGSHARGAR